MQNDRPYVVMYRGSGLDAVAMVADCRRVSIVGLMNTRAWRVDSRWQSNHGAVIRKAALLAEQYGCDPASVYGAGDE